VMSRQTKKSHRLLDIEFSARNPNSQIILSESITIQFEKIEIVPKPCRWSGGQSTSRITLVGVEYKTGAMESAVVCGVCNVQLSIEMSEWKKPKNRILA